MLTQTSEMAIRALIYLGRQAEDQPVTPRRIAEATGSSPTYLVKTLRLLVKAGILRSQRGAHGGVILLRDTASITLLEIVEACQGLIVGNYCRSLSPEQNAGACAFHRAMQDVYDATVGALSRWTLADLIGRPLPDGPDLDPCHCKMMMPFLAAEEPGRRSR